MKEETKKPSPGSNEAVDLGCTCPVLDNHYGRGENGQFWITFGCPIHHPSKSVTAVPDVPEKIVTEEPEGPWALVYTDEGAKGPCGQSAHITTPWTRVWIFDTLDKLHEWLTPKYKGMKNGGRKKPRFNYCGPRTNVTKNFIAYMEDLRCKPSAE